MSSVEEILELRRKLDEMRAGRVKQESEGATAQRQAELDKEAAKLKAEIANEEAIAFLLADAGQVSEGATHGVERTPEEILFAAEVAQASAYGVDQKDINEEVARRKAEAKENAAADNAAVVSEDPKPASTAPSLTSNQPRLTTEADADKEQEK